MLEADCPSSAQLLTRIPSMVMRQTVGLPPSKRASNSLVASWPLSCGLHVTLSFTAQLIRAKLSDEVALWKVFVAFVPRNRSPKDPKHPSFRTPALREGRPDIPWVCDELVEVETAICVRLVAESALAKDVWPWQAKMSNKQLPHYNDRVER